MKTDKKLLLNKNTINILSLTTVKGGAPDASCTMARGQLCCTPQSNGGEAGCVLNCTSVC